MNSKRQVLENLLSQENQVTPILEVFRQRVSILGEDYQLTQMGKDLACGVKWKFEGNSYRQAWGYLFSRARQLGLTYCKHFKRFYKPLPPKPAVGDRVQLTSTGATGTVTGYSRFAVLVSIDKEKREVEVSVEYLEKL